MKPLLYLLWRRYINGLKRTFKKPLSAVITVLAAVGMLSGMISAFIIPRKGIGGDLDIVVSCILLGMALLFTNAMISSKQAGIFTLQDANFLFQAPIKPAYVLFMAILDVIPASLLTALLFTFYFPFLTGSSMGVGDYLLTLLLTALLITFTYLIFYYVYILDTEYQGIRAKAKYAVWVFMGLVAAAFVLVLYTKGFNLSEAASAFFSSPFYNAIPVFGWAKWGVVGAIQGQYLTAYLPALLLMAGLDVLMVFAIMRCKADFYEQALSDSYKINEILQSAKSDNYDVRSITKVKTKQAKGSFQVGAAALFSKQILEMRKTSTMFVFRELLSGLVYIAMAFFLKLDYWFVFMMIVFMSLSSSTGDTWNKDFKKPYVYLIPESSLKKVLYSVLPGYLKTLFNGAVILVLAGFIFKAAAMDVVAFIIIYASLSLVFVLAEVLSYRVMNGMKNAMALAFLRSLFAAAGALPSGIAALIAMILLQDRFTVVYMLPILLLVNLALSLLMAYLSRSLFECSEIA